MSPLSDNQIDVIARQVLSKMAGAVTTDSPTNLLLALCTEQAVRPPPLSRFA